MTSPEQRRQIKRLLEKRRLTREAEATRRANRQREKRENARRNIQVDGYSADQGGYSVISPQGDRIEGVNISEHASFGTGESVDFDNRGRSAAIDKLGTVDLANGEGVAGGSGSNSPGLSGQNPTGNLGLDDGDGSAPDGSRWRDDGMGGCVLTTQPGDTDLTSDKETKIGIDDPPTFGEDYGVDIDWDGGSESINYTPSAGDSAVDIAQAVADAINNNANLGSSGFAASADGSSVSFNRGNGLGGYNSTETGGSNSGDVSYGNTADCQNAASDGQPGSWACNDFGSGAECVQVIPGKGSYSTKSECEAALVGSLPGPPVQGGNCPERYTVHHTSTRPSNFTSCGQVTISGSSNSFGTGPYLGAEWVVQDNGTTVSGVLTATFASGPVFLAGISQASSQNTSLCPGSFSIISIDLVRADNTSKEDDIAECGNSSVPECPRQAWENTENADWEDTSSIEWDQL